MFVPNRWVSHRRSGQIYIKNQTNISTLPVSSRDRSSGCFSSIYFYSDSSSKNIEANQHVKPKPEELKQQLQLIREKTYEQVQFSDLTKNEKEILLTRLDIVHLTSKAVYADMLYACGYAYMKDSEPFRRLRESYFLINLTPTVKQLEKLREKV